MDSVLTPKIEKLIKERLQSGHYHSAAEMLEDALGALDEREDRKLHQLRVELDHADDQMERGEFTEYDQHTVSALAETVKARGKAKVAAEREPPTA
jgi:antitoxin ParD1/3/4